MDYKQKHPETCLAKCLLILIGKLKNVRLESNKELDLLLYSLKYGRENIARGHLEKAARDFGVKIKWIVDSRVFYDFTKKGEIPKGVSLENKKINAMLISKIIGDPLILYIDRFYLWERGDGLYHKYHYPHFIIVLEKSGGGYKIIDPEKGKVRIVSPVILSRSISGLRNCLWISPQIMQIYE